LEAFEKEREETTVVHAKWNSDNAGKRRLGALRLVLDLHIRTLSYASREIRAGLPIWTECIASKGAISIGRRMTTCMAPKKLALSSHKRSLTRENFSK
jgi:hypothetical protein